MWANADTVPDLSGSGGLPENMYAALRTKTAPLQFFDVDGSVARADRERRAAGIQLAAHGRMAQRAGNLNRNVQRDAAIAGVRVQIRVQISRQAHGDVPVAGMQIPAVGHFRAAAHLGLDAAVAGLQRQRVEASVNAQVAVAGVGVELAVEVVPFDMPIAGVNSDVALDVSGGHVAIASIELNLARNSLGGDVTVAGTHVQIQFARHAHFYA